MMVIKLGYYRKEEWEKFKSIIDDKESMHSSWYKWHESYSKEKRDLEKKGLLLLKRL